MKIVVHNTDCGVSITFPFGKSSSEVASEISGSIEIDISEMPDIEYQAAYSVIGSTCLLSIDKAKEIRRNHFRALRKAKLEKLDIESIKSLEAGDAVKLADISSKKQALRDVTTLPLPDTLEEIKATLPDILA